MVIWDEGMVEIVAVGGMDENLETNLEEVGDLILTKLSIPLFYLPIL